MNWWPFSACLLRWSGWFASDREDLGFGFGKNLIRDCSLETVFRHIYDRNKYRRPHWSRNDLRSRCLCHQCCTCPAPHQLSIIFMRHSPLLASISYVIGATYRCLLTRSSSFHGLLHGLSKSGIMLSWGLRTVPDTVRRLNLMVWIQIVLIVNFHSMY